MGILALFPSLIDLAVTWVKGKTAVKKTDIAAHERMQNDLTADNLGANAIQAVQLIVAKNLTSLRDISFGVFLLAYIMSGFLPHFMAQFFENINYAMPEIYRQCFLGMLCYIWGWGRLKDAVLFFKTVLSFR